jgi:hypothetical protein
VEGGVQDACDDTCSICLDAFCDSNPSTVCWNRALPVCDRWAYCAFVGADIFFAGDELQAWLPSPVHSWMVIVSNVLSFSSSSKLRSYAKVPGSHNVFVPFCLQVINLMKLSCLLTHVWPGWCYSSL